MSKQSLQETDQKVILSWTGFCEDGGVGSPRNLFPYLDNCASRFCLT